MIPIRAEMKTITEDQIILGITDNGNIMRKQRIKCWNCTNSICLSTLLNQINILDLHQNLYDMSSEFRLPNPRYKYLLEADIFNSQHYYDTGYCADDEYDETQIKYDSDGQEIRFKDSGITCPCVLCIEGAKMQITPIGCHLFRLNGSDYIYYIICGVCIDYIENDATLNYNFPE